MLDLGRARWVDSVAAGTSDVGGLLMSFRIPEPGALLLLGLGLAGAALSLRLTRVWL